MSDNRQQQQSQQTFLGMPMNWEWDVRKMARNYWNPDDERVFPPKVFGIGWDLNGYALFRRLGVLPGRETRKE
jgi:5-formyltetrahydrofolate cyclo-ligase